VGEAHDVFHVVLDRLDEARAALGIFVLGGGALGLMCLAVIKPITLAGIFSNAVLTEQTNIEPYRRVECAVLVDAQPGQFIEKYFAVRFAEVTILYTPVRNRTADAMNELADGGFALLCFQFAIKIF
jgi:hypothetical protein